MYEETRQILHKQFSDYLFVIDGRLRPDIRLPGESCTKKNWNAVLRGMGLGDHAGLQPWEKRRDADWAAGGSNSPTQTWGERTDEEEEQNEEDAADHKRWKSWTGGIPDSTDARPRERRPLFSIPRSDWRRILEARLAVIFDRKPCDQVIQKLAEYLSRDEGWHEWWWARDLQELYRQAFEDPKRWRLVGLLEGVAFQRGNISRQRKSTREPFRMSFSMGQRNYVFALPRRASGKPTSLAIRLGAFVFAARIQFIRQRRIDPKILAAAVWKAGRFLEEPTELRGWRLTLHRTASDLNLTARQVWYSAQKLKAAAADLTQSS